MMNKMLISVFVFTLFLLAQSCDNANQTVPQVQPAAHRVEVYEVCIESVQREIEGFGNLSFRKKIDITTAVDGIILTLDVEEGEHVKAGDRLGELFNIQLEIRAQQADAALFSAEAAYELAETQYREGRLQVESRLLSIEKSELNLAQKELELEHQREKLDNEKELLAIGGATEDEAAAIELTYSALKTEVEILRKDISIKKIGFRDIDIQSFGYRLPNDEEVKRQILFDINSLTLKSELKAAEARVRSAGTECDSAAALLNETSLYTRIDGIVGARYMEEGERVSASDKLYTIFSSSGVDLVFSVPEEIGVLLQIGQIVIVRLDAVKDREFKAAVSRINPTIDTRSGNISIRAGLENVEDLFKPGMFSRFHLAYGLPRSLIRIPSATLIARDGNRAEVLRVTGDRAFPQPVTIGGTSGGMYELEEGLEAGDLIIMNPSPLIREGDPVDVR